MDHLIKQAEKLPASASRSMIIGYISDAAKTRNPLAASIALGSAAMLAQQTYAAADAIDLGIDTEQLKTLILGLIATIAVIGTAYITVLVGISAFSLIRRVVRG